MTRSTAHSATIERYGRFIDRDHRHPLGRLQCRHITPSVVGASGAVEVLEHEMDDQVRAALAHSAEVLREALSTVET